MQSLVALVAGLLFGLGLVVSRMVDPPKVLGFLDVGAIASGGWDPSLAFVMVGALLVNAPLVWLARRRGRPLLAPSLDLPMRRDLDARLIAGALLFGVGWGLVGYCPGPALAALGSGAGGTLVFVAAMIVGMVFYRWTMAPRSA
ncbi:MAG: YeeE/YedE family protein [Alphaproteobacteria bacterium]|nr:YeeE/YedE family protein [Alphaproteobacteria bacterium]